MSQSCFRTFAHPSYDPQMPADVAVVIATLVRPTLKDTLHSIFRQERVGRVHVIIGVDVPQNEMAVVEDACRDRPAHCCVSLMYPGYSTSVRHGGVHVPRDCGVLRGVLTYLANSRYVAYVDDDNWWADHHLRTMLAAIAGNDWAYSLRWFVHHATRRPVCVDTWESVGPGKGVHVQKFGGWVDPNCVMIDKIACDRVVPWWMRPLPGDPKAMSADRHVYHWLAKNFRGRATEEPSVYYQVDPGDVLHASRLKRMGTAYARAGEAGPETAADGGFRAPGRL
jgi:hypothetical protein